MIEDPQTITIQIPEALKERVLSYKALHGISLSAIVRSALFFYLEWNGAPPLPGKTAPVVRPEPPTIESLEGRLIDAIAEGVKRAVRARRRKRT